MISIPLPDVGPVDSTAPPSELTIAMAYNELRRIARYHLQRQVPGQTLDPTALVHEAWIKLQKSDAAGMWKDQKHLCRTVAAVMWQILIDRSRRAQSERHGGHLNRTDQDLQQIAADSTLEELQALAPALERLSTEHPRLAEIVQMRFFAGLSHEQVAELLESSVATVRRQWTLARTLLHSYLQT
ncbi:MAG: ECF-type sigma factor [Planctomycetota bacterium]